MLNVTAEQPGVGAGVLLRALEPLYGIELMQRHRKTNNLFDLARGPGRLRLHCRLTSVSMDLTCVLMDRFGSALRFRRVRILAKACASASPARSAGCCVFLR
jgi:3-methyladenine DNA glycosylase Mpg